MGLKFTFIGMFGKYFSERELRPLVMYIYIPERLRWRRFGVEVYLYGMFGKYLSERELRHLVMYMYTREVKVA